MPASLPVPSKGALRALRNLALGTSCTVAISAGLLTEDRRRRINIAREVHSNAKKLKCARQYHSAGGATVETFEEQALKYRDDAFWLPSNVLRNTEAALQADERGIDIPDHDVLVPEDVPASSLFRLRPRDLLRNKLPTTRKLPGFEPIPLRPPKNPVFLGSGSVEFEHSKFDRQRLTDLIDELFKVVETNDVGLNEQFIETAIELHGACKEQKMRDKIFDMVLSHGRITETQFHSFNPEDTISRLITRSGAANLDPAKLKKALSIYLTIFTAPPRVMSEGMLSLGVRLCSEAAQLQMYRFTRQLFFRMESSRGDRPPQAVDHLIRATRQTHHKKKIFRYFQEYYTQTFPSQREFSEVCRTAVESMIELQRLDLAEQVLVSATRMAEEQNLLTPTIGFLMVLRHHWKSHRDITGTRSLFSRLEALLPHTRSPQALYSSIIQFCVEAREEDAAALYFKNLRQAYKPNEHDARIHAHFALAKAFREDWDGVLEELTTSHNMCSNVGQHLSPGLTPIVREYAKSHSLTEIEEYIGLLTAKFGLKINVALMNFMVATYAKEKEVDSIVRWIDYAIINGCAVDAKTINIILKNCRFLWNFTYQQVYALFLSIRAKGGKSTNLLDSSSVALLRQIAVSSTRNPSEAMERLGEFDKNSKDLDYIYRSMSTNFAEKKFEAILAEYKRAQEHRARLECRHLKLAVKASLGLHENISETTLLIRDGQQRGIDVNHAIANVFIHQVTELLDEGVHMDRLVNLCHSTITAFQKASTGIPLQVVTHTASCLQQRGYNGPAIDLWNSMSSRLGILPSSFDRASITSLLNAYIGLQDHAGVRWVIHMLSANKLYPDHHIKLAFKVAKRKTIRLIESQPCSNEVHVFLDSILEGLEKIKVMRKAATEEQTDVRAKTIMIVMRAIDDLNTQKEGQARSVGQPQTVKPTTKKTAQQPALEMEDSAWVSDEDEIIHDVNTQRLTAASNSM